MESTSTPKPDVEEPRVADTGITFALRVRYFETDQMGVAHHANYPVWFEAARSEFCRLHGIDYGQMERDGMLLPIVELNVRYLSPARYDDDITVRAWVTEVKRSLLTMRYEVTRAATVLATGQTLQMLIDRESSRPRRFPTEIAARFTATPNHPDLER
jgi:acyl-CoA thioester hydrolase